MPTTITDSTQVWYLQVLLFVGSSQRVTSIPSMPGYTTLYSLHLVDSVELFYLVYYQSGKYITTINLKAQEKKM